jgi:hypothetical protein
MSDPSENPRLLDLRHLVEAELAAADTEDPDFGEPGSWLVAPTDADWTAVGLHSLLGAIQAIGDVPAAVTPPEIGTP